MSHLISKLKQKEVYITAVVTAGIITLVNYLG
jgi:hypothetical protein